MTKAISKGIVLAGGKSRRFGEDKAVAEISGQKLLEIPVRLLSDLGLEVTVIANSDRDYSFLNCRVENDIESYKGPVGGLATAFQLFPDEPLLVLTCDMPNLTKKILKDLLRTWKKQNSVVLFESEDDRYQPFPGIYDASVLRPMTHSATSGDLSMQSLLRSVSSIHFVPLPENSRYLFRNVNKKDDLAGSEEFNEQQ